jgi:hypothetical protein
MKQIKIFASLLALIVLLAACGGDVDVVESGTYQGTIDKVKADEEEIYVNLDNGKRIELYFTEETKLMRDTMEVPFTELSANQKIEVEVKKVGKRLDPLTVKILE